MGQIRDGADEHGHGAFTAATPGESSPPGGPSTGAVSPRDTPDGDPSTLRKFTEGRLLPSWISDASGLLRFVNAAWCEFTGRSQDANLGDGWIDSVHPEDRARVRETLRACTSNRRYDQTEHRLRRHDGAYRFVVHTFSPYSSASGEYAGHIGACVDVTAHRNAAQVAQARVRLNEVAVHESIDQVIQRALDEAEELTASDIAFFHFLEADQKTVTLQTWSTNTLARMCTAEGKGAHYPIEQAGVWADCARTRRPTIHNDYASLPNRKGLPEGHAPVMREVVVPLLRGDSVVAIMGVGNSPRPYDDEDVEVVRSLADAVYDAVERRRTEDALARSEERLRLALEATSDGLWDWDVPARRVWWSPRLYRMLGYEPGADAAVEWVLGLIHPDDLDLVVRAFGEHIDERADGCTVEARWRTGHHDWKWLLTRGRTVARDAQGRPLRMVGTHQDITSRRREEDERLQMERRLLQTQKFESLGVLAGGIAHDFNNLLTVALGNLELAMLDVSAQPELASYLQEAFSAGRQAADLTRQLLAYSGQGRFLVHEVDLNDLVTDSSQLLRAAVSKNVSMATLAERGALRVHGDPGQLKQVVLNLVTNASEAVGAEPGTVTVATGTMDCDAAWLAGPGVQGDAAPGRFAWLEVADSGCGMDPYTLSRLFDPFFSTKSLGRGLGMPAVLGIVRAHKGAIHVESTPGQGSRFRILLPLSEPRRVTAASGTEARRGRSATARMVLFVDDEEGIRLVCQRALAQAGYKVLTAADGEEAVGIFAAHREEIGVVVLDLTMPRMDGLAAYTALQAIEPGVRVILCSGFSEQDALRGFEARPLAGFLHKPYSNAALCAQVAGVVGEPGTA